MTVGYKDTREVSIFQMPTVGHLESTFRDKIAKDYVSRAMLVGPSIAREYLCGCSAEVDAAYLLAKKLGSAGVAAADSAATHVLCPLCAGKGCYGCDRSGIIGRGFSPRPEPVSAMTEAQKQGCVAVMLAGITAMDMVAAYGRDNDDTWAAVQAFRSECYKLADMLDGFDANGEARSLAFELAMAI